MSFSTGQPHIPRQRRQQVKPKHRFRATVLGWQVSWMWGNGFGFRFRIHRWREPDAGIVRFGALLERADIKWVIKLRPTEWEAICQAADATGSGTYDFIKRSVLAAANHEAAWEEKRLA